MSAARAIRRASARDLDDLERIEASGDAQFAALFGPSPFGPDSSESGHARAAQPGFLLVLAEDPDGPPIGFAHVLEPTTTDPTAPGRPSVHLAHLEQLSVLPEHGRRGHGAALVAAARAEAARRGHERITLRTYARVPWNAPFYERCGFTVVDPSEQEPGACFGTAFHRALIAHEQELDLQRHGPRVLMVAPTIRASALPAPDAAPPG